MNYAGIGHRPESEDISLVGTDKVQLRLRTARDDVAQVAVVYGDPYAIPNKHARWFEHRVPMERRLQTDVYDYWMVTITEPKHRLAYGFYVTGVDGDEVLYVDQGIKKKPTEAELTNENIYFRLPYFHQIDAFHAPQWVNETVWYQIFPERFANGNPELNPAGTKEWDSTVHPGRQDFYGGDLQGVLDHLDHLVDLGVNGIYFNPIFKAPSNHKYDTEDYFEIDPHFGDKKLFKRLVQEAHKRGIRVMLDAVFNHIGDQSPQWQDVIKNGAGSKYADWFHIHEFPVHYTPTDNFEFTDDANYETFSYTPHMPKLNTANPEVQDYLLSIATYWIKEFDIDAWRLDVANEIDHHFWRRFHDATTALKPDFYILGEIWHTAEPWLQGDQFTGVMNYAYTDNIKRHFLTHEIDAPQMIAELNAILMHYSDQADSMMFNVLDSHDTARIKTLAHDNMDLTRQILAFTFMQPGTPSIYYGTEYGMTGENDPDDRKPMVWDPELQDQMMYGFMQRLVRVRQQVANKLTVSRMKWAVDADNVITLDYGAVRITVNTGDQAATVNSQGDVLLAQNYENGQLTRDGFVIATN